MKATISIGFRCLDEETSAGLRDVLQPDNEGAPKGLRLSMELKGSVLNFTIGAPSASSALSTAAAVMRDVSLFERVWLLSRPEES